MPNKYLNKHIATLNRTSLNFLVEHYVNNCFPTSCKGWHGSGALISPRERFWVLLSGISSILFSQFTILSGVFGSILKFLQGLFLTKYDTGPFFNVFPRLIAFFVSLLAIIFYNMRKYYLFNYWQMLEKKVLGTLRSSPRIVFSITSWKLAFRLHLPQLGWVPTGKICFPDFIVQ